MEKQKTAFKISGKEVIVTEGVAYIYCPTCKYNQQLAHDAPKEDHAKLEEDLSEHIMCFCEKNKHLGDADARQRFHRGHP